MVARRPLFGADRATTFGAAKWKNVKRTLKLLRQKNDQTFEYVKSAELMAELLPAARADADHASGLQGIAGAAVRNGEQQCVSRRDGRAEVGAERALEIVFGMTFGWRAPESWHAPETALCGPRHQHIR